MNNDRMKETRRLELVLKKYAHLIKDWDSDKDERTGDGGYFVYLKRPYVVDVSGQITDMISESTVQAVELYLKRAYKINESAWDNL